MAVIVTERWSAIKLTPWESAAREWDVTGVVDEAAAWAAVGPQAYFNAQLPQDPTQFARQPEISRTGPACFRVHLPYKFDLGENKSDPTHALPRYKWSPASETGPTDVAADKTTLANSAGFPFSSDPTGDFPYRVLTVSRFEANYSVGLAEAFEGRVNQDAVTIPRAGTVAPGRMLFRSYEPLQEYYSNQTDIRSAYTFWLKAGNIQDGDGLWDSWKYRILDQGFTGWYNSGGGLKSGPFVYAGSKNPVTEPVLLDCTGQPYLSGKYLVQDAAGSGQTPVSYQTLNPNLLEDTGKAVFLKFLKHAAVAFAPLSLFY